RIAVRLGAAPVHGDDQLVPVDLAGGERGVVHPARPGVQDADVQPPRDQVADLLAARRLPQLQLDARIAAAVPAQQPGQHPLARRADEADGEPAHLPAPGLPRHPLRPLRVPQDEAGLGEERRARGGEVHLPRRALEQPDPELVLQRAQLPAQPRLVDAEPGRGPGEVQLLREDDDVAELVQIHIPIGSVATTPVNNAARAPSAGHARAPCDARCRPSSCPPPWPARSRCCSPRPRRRTPGGTSTTPPRPGTSPARSWTSAGATRTRMSRSRSTGPLRYPRAGRTSTSPRSWRRSAVARCSRRPGRTRAAPPSCTSTSPPSSGWPRGGWR